MYLNSSSIYWSSKKQGSIETNLFAREFIALKTSCEHSRGLRYKIFMMGIPNFVYGDNKSVLVNYSKTYSVFQKKYYSIAYHFLREGVSKDEWRVAYINTDENFADMLTKPLTSGMKQTKFTQYGSSSYLWDVKWRIGSNILSWTSNQYLIMKKFLLFYFFLFILCIPTISYQLGSI